MVSNKKAPSLFLGHGSPMNVIETNQFNDALIKMAPVISEKIRNGEIKSIIVISAHWQTSGTMVQESLQPKTIHDFYGFPQALYDMHYDAVGSSEIAQEIAETLKPFKAKTTEDWGLDHGAWNVLWHLLPNKEVPIIALSLDFDIDFSTHYEIGKKLQALRSKGHMILGSGNIVHSFRGIDFSNQSVGHPHAISFEKYVKEQLQSRFDQKLIHIDSSELSSFQFSVNSAEHYIPLLYVLGASDESEKAFIFSDEIVFSTLSMLSVGFGLD
jgi:4,5-DOPA dioxygenase extradiol